MFQQVSRQVALMTVLVTCMLLIALVLALGLDGNTASALAQATPLAIVLGGALTFLLADPFSAR